MNNPFTQAAKEAACSIPTTFCCKGEDMAHCCSCGGYERILNAHAQDRLNLLPELPDVFVQALVYQVNMWDMPTENVSSDSQLCQLALQALELAEKATADGGSDG